MKRESSPAHETGTFRKTLETHREIHPIALKEGVRPDPLLEPKYQNLLDGVRVTVGEHYRDYRGGLDVVNLRGKNVRIIVSHENMDLHGSYGVRDQVINFGQSAIADLENDPDLFWSACVHELAHMRYFDLDRKAQTEVNDFIVREFPNELRDFQEKLYSAQGGDRYLKVHQVGITSTAIPFRFVGAGLRDWRVMTAKMSTGSNATVDVRLGILVTEFLSHTSPLYVGSGAYEKELVVNHFSSSHPSFYGAAAEFKRRVDADSSYSAFMRKSGIFIDADQNSRERIFHSVLAAKARSQRN